jgi:hypothetical protein
MKGAERAERGEDGGDWNEGGEKPERAESTVEQEAAVLRKRAEQAEPQITPIAEHVNGESGGTRVGEKNVLKSEERVARKIRGDVKQGLDPRGAAEDVDDSVRYASTYSEGAYWEGAGRALDDYKAQGCQVDRVKVRWDEDDRWRGINAKLRAPDGFRFEHQFHTEDSWDVSQKTHDRYEDLQGLDPNDPEAAQLNREITSANDSLRNPPGGESFRRKYGG